MSNWTEGRLKSFITSTLRGAFRKFPPKYETLKEAYVGIRHNGKTKRDGKHYRCAGCSGEFPTSEVNVDHIIPVVDPKYGFQGWDVFISRLFCSKDNLQVLCSNCHDLKTKEERATKTSANKKSSGNSRRKTRV